VYKATCSFISYTKGIIQMGRYVYFFGNGKADGDASMKNLLGGKGANLADMSRHGIPVPPGFTITTEVCTVYNQEGPEVSKKLVEEEVLEALSKVEKILGAKFGDSDNPCLFSVRSGARVSMPGMMDTVLNLGLNDTVVAALAKRSNNERFAWDSYRRFVQMYGDVVLGMKPANKQDADPFEEILDEVKKAKGVKSDTELTTGDLKELVIKFKSAVLKRTGKTFPESSYDQLWGAINSVFDSWENERAILYRRMNGYPGEWGTAVNVQAMVFGNMGNSSATGVAFTRDAATGENIFNGEYLVNAQGEDVVAGVRTPRQITLEGSRRWAKLAEVGEDVRAKEYPSLEELMPEIYKDLFDTQALLEKTYRDMQDLEFTVQDGRLWLLQTRNGKRTGAAMIKIAMDLLKEGVLEEREVLSRIEPGKLDELLHPVFSKSALKMAKIIAKGLPASPGAATGQLVFFADDAEVWANSGKKVILDRTETSPEDLKGMNLAQGIFTSRGGMTSHAAVVARGMGKCCVSGAEGAVVDYKTKTLTAGGKVYREGDWVSLNGSTGEVYDGKVDTVNPEITGDFLDIMNMSGKYSGDFVVRANADTPRDAKQALNFGAKGIGLCRTEHMFFEGNRIIAVREMILADNEEGRKRALAKLLPIQRQDFLEIFEAMKGYPVTIRLLDPPLHEFVPHDDKGQLEMAKTMGVDIKVIKDKVNNLHEFNPMLGHRGCRLGNTYPEITAMQARAIIEAALSVSSAKPEIMIPLTGTLAEFKMQEDIIRDVAKEVFAEKGKEIDFKVGTMIEVPRAALVADEIAKSAQFFSFGTNDLTQMTFGYSRDDAGKFLPIYLSKNILKQDPFQSLDQEGVGQLVKIGIEKGRSVKNDLKVGICGEHGGDPASIEFCVKAGMNYVSCSPFRVPIARIAVAKAKSL
jgi:pyruvate,orthophosphate dikinase